MKRLFLFLMCALLVCSAVSADIIASKIYVDPNPKPNMTEKYVPLKKVKTVGPEVAPDIFIYKPLSMTLDKDGNLYVFDRGQHKIVQLDKNLKFVRFIGEGGKGEGKFSRVPEAAVNINVGLDNKLYCTDSAAHKIILFDTNGNYIKEIRSPGVKFGKSTVDKNGQIYFFSGNDHEIEAKDQEGKSILKIPVIAEDVYSMLFYKQNLYRNNFDIFFMHTILKPKNLLLYFSNSSTMLEVSGNEIVRKYRILPEDRLSEYKKSLARLDKRTNFHIPFFARLIPDGDVNGVYYLPHIKNQTTNCSLLYQMNMNGELQKTYYVEYDQKPGVIWILAKKNNLFYAKKTRDEVIQVYKEEE